MKQVDIAAVRDSRLDETTYWLLQAIESVTEFGRLQRRLSGDDECAAVFAAARAQLTRLLPFHVLGFWMVEDSGGDFVPADCASGDAERLRAEIDSAIESGAFAWAVGQNRSVRTLAVKPREILVLHALPSGSRVVGMFAGLVREDAHDVAEPVWDLLSLILVGTGQALDNAALYRRLVQHARELEQAVETRTQDLKTSVAENRRLYRRARRAYRELSRTKDHLVQAQKIEAIGQLAGGVAHDFNNLLTVIAGSSELLLSTVSASDPGRRHVDVIRQTATRAAALTRQLLAFSRRQLLQPRLLNVRDVIVNIEQMLRRLLGEDIELHTRCDPGTGHVWADPSQLDQVVLNLAVNARDAMPDGGRLLIETSNADVDDDFVRAHTGARPGRYVRLQVTDTGIGMDATVRAHLFEPFFTTKGVGHGTGLGLATVYGIVKQSGGFIWVDSAPVQCARFTIDLPWVDAPTAVTDGAGPSARLPKGTETILVVEDEKAVRRLAREVLVSRGYTVLEASHGEEALRVVADHAGPIDLMVTDVVMPRMNGRDLVDRLIPIRPGMKVVYMSGYTDDAVVARGVETAGLTFLQKPFTLDVLARTVRAVLDV